MPNHEYFRELSALAAIGQLSSEEDRELSQHLYDCPSCCEANSEYAHVVQHQLPQADPVRWRMKHLRPKTGPDADLRDRFLARARAEGVEFTPEAELDSSPTRRIPLQARRWQRVLAITGAAVIVAMGGEIYRLHERSATLGKNGQIQSRMQQENEILQTQLAAIRQTIDKGSAELATVRKDKSTSEEEVRRLQAQLEDARSRSETLTVQVQQIEAKQIDSASENRQKDSQIAELSAKNEKLRRDNVESLSERVLLESQVRDLSNSIEQQASNFERERQLTTASKDVRQLMGARNLHIMDVHDTDGAGKASRAFGRVFYAEGQSLIFYAFDLQSGKLSPAKYTFQAWGQKESVSHSVRNLGTFAVDDHEQRRWVLKVNDAKLLEGIDSVFVTAEVLGDAGGPRGKKILYAYIVGEPNHP